MVNLFVDLGGCPGVEGLVIPEEVRANKRSPTQEESDRMLPLVRGYYRGLLDVVAHLVKLETVEFAPQTGCTAKIPNISEETAEQVKQLLTQGAAGKPKYAQPSFGTY